MVNALFDAFSFLQAPYMFFIVAALATIAAGGPEANVRPTREDDAGSLPVGRLRAALESHVSRRQPRRVLVHAAGALAETASPGPRSGRWSSRRH